MSHRRAIATAVIALALGVLLQAQPETPRPTCRSLLTEGEVVAAIGRPAALFETEQSSPGSSRCRWTWDDAAMTLTVSVSDAEAIAANAGATKCCPLTSVPMVQQFFDHAVRVEVELGTELPATLTDFRQRAVIFFDPSYLKVIVQLPDGVAQLLGVKVSRDQIVALAHALVAP